MREKIVPKGKPTLEDKKKAVRRLRELRAKMIPHAQKMGIHTDQDVFDRVS